LQQSLIDGNRRCFSHFRYMTVAVEDCLWAQFIAATRGSDAGTGDSSLHPLHDLLNHSDTPNCAAGVSTEQEG
jgi:hypothetical protein